MIDVTLSLVSHTNVGKTTLARTLLRTDVGEVLDQPHVTEISEAFTAIESEHARLRLWDTPGLGDTIKLVKRLRQEQNPLGWFLHQVWDRTINRPLWCSQEALRNVKEDADVVLYLVNAAESPRDAGYVEPELEILSWIGRPTLVLLNQTGDTGSDAAGLVDEWRGFLQDHDIVHGLLMLDAFTRSWVQENVLFEHVVPLLSGEKQAAMRKLASAWTKRNNSVFRRSMELIASDVARAATDHEPLPGAFASKAQKKEAMDALSRRLEESQSELWEKVVEEHGLEGRYASEVIRNLDAFVVSGEEALTPQRSAIVGGVVSGAIGGLAADVLSGGLSFGGGMLAGAILGAVGGAGLSHTVRLLKLGDTPAVSWGPDFLDRLFERSILRYLAVAHFGRGRGRFEAQSEPAAWGNEVRAAVAARIEEFGRRWKDGAESGSEARPRIARALQRELTEIVDGILLAAYPESDRPHE